MATLKKLGCQRLVANLVEVMGGRESIDLVLDFVNAVHEKSESMTKEKCKAKGLV